MGCAASTATSVSSPPPPPAQPQAARAGQSNGPVLPPTAAQQAELLGRMTYAKLGVENLDGFMARAAAANGGVVDAHNGLCEVLLHAQDQIAAAHGTFLLDMDISKRQPGQAQHVVVDRDTVLLKLEKAAGGLPSPQEVGALCAKPWVVEADKKLAKSIAELHAFSERHNVTLLQQGKELAASVVCSVEVGAANQALAELRSAVGGDMRVTLSVYPAGARSCKGVHLGLKKPIIQEDTGNVEYADLSVLDIARAKSAQRIHKSLYQAVGSCAALAKCLHAVPADLFKLSAIKHVLVLETKAEDPEDPASPAVAEALQGLRKAVSDANRNISELRGAVLSSQGEVPCLASGLADLHQKIVEGQAQQMGMHIQEALGVVKFEPAVKNEESSISFQLPSEVSAKEGQVNTQEMVEQLLSPQGKLLYRALTSVSEAGQEAGHKVQSLQAEVKNVGGQVDGVFDQYEEAIKQAFPDKDPKHVDALISLAKKNLEAVKGSTGVLDAYNKLVADVSTELDQACKVIKDKSKGGSS